MKYIPAILIVGAVVLFGVTMTRKASKPGYMDMRESFKDLIVDHRDFWSDGHRNEKIVCAQNVAEALSMFEKWLLPTLEDVASLRLNRLRSRISAGKSWMYRVSNREYDKYYLLNLFPEIETLGNYSFNYFTCDVKKATKEYCPPEENHGSVDLCRDPLWKSDEPSSFERIVSRFPKAREPKESDSVWLAKECDVIAIMDVVDVQLMGVEGVDLARQFRMEDLCTAHYRIWMDLRRREEKGSINASSLFLDVRRSHFDFRIHWLYYRGMTLKIWMTRVGNEFVVVKLCPVLPYEPFSENDIVLSRGSVGKAQFDDRLSRIQASLIVQYGGHTKVEFLPGDVIVSGKVELQGIGPFLDYGVSSKLNVLELKAGGNEEYWRDAWFVKTNELYIYSTPRPSN